MYNSKDWSWFAPCINDQGGWQVKQKDSLMRSLLFRGVLLAALGVAVLGGATDDYSLSIEGPRTAYAGYDVYVRVNIQFTGPVGHVYFSAVDEPAGISHEIICHSGPEIAGRALTTSRISGIRRAQPTPRSGSSWRPIWSRGCIVPA